MESREAFLLHSLDYMINGTVNIPNCGIPEKQLVYVAGHHEKLKAFGTIRFIQGLQHTPETEVTFFYPRYFGINPLGISLGGFIFLIVSVRGLFAIINR
jgi:hypothetical protein